MGDWGGGLIGSWVINKKGLQTTFWTGTIKSCRLTHLTHPTHLTHLCHSKNGKIVRQEREKPCGCPNRNVNNMLRNTDIIVRKIDYLLSKD
jgi:hypothetical protein